MNINEKLASWEAQRQKSEDPTCISLQMNQDTSLTTKK